MIGFCNEMRDLGLLFSKLKEKWPIRHNLKERDLGCKFLQIYQCQYYLNNSNVQFNRSSSSRAICKLDNIITIWLQKAIDYLWFLSFILGNSTYVMHKKTYSIWNLAQYILIFLDDLIFKSSKVNLVWFPWLSLFK